MGRIATRCAAGLVVGALADLVLAAPAAADVADPGELSEGSTVQALLLVVGILAALAAMMIVGGVLLRRRARRSEALRPPEPTSIRGLDESAALPPGGRGPAAVPAEGREEGRAGGTGAAP